MVNFFTTVVGIFTRLINGLTALTSFLLFVIWLHTRDLYYTIANLFLPSRRVGRVVPPGRPGHRAVWPNFKAPIQASDSRSPCPA
ncbi:hypothetical protein MPH_11494, partial [Macrophomina phaseolina MS6]